MLAVQLAHEACQSASAPSGSRKSGGAQGWEVVGLSRDLLVLVPEGSSSSQAQPIAVQGRDEAGVDGGVLLLLLLLLVMVMVGSSSRGSSLRLSPDSKIKATSGTAGPGGAGGKGAGAAGGVGAGAATHAGGGAADTTGTAAAGGEDGGGYGFAQALGAGLEDIQRAAAGNSVIGPGIKEEMW